MNSLMVVLMFLTIKGEKNGNKGKTSLTWFGVIGESSDTRHQGVQEWEAVCFLVEETSTFSQKVGDFC